MRGRVRPATSSDDATHGYLLVLEEGAGSVRRVALDGTVTMGGPGSDVIVGGGTATGPVVRVTLVEGEAHIESLIEEGVSVNGELLRGRRLLTGGDFIAVLRADIVFHRDGGVVPRALVPFAELVRRLDEEAERSVRYRRPLSVVCIALGASPQERERITTTVLCALRAVDFGAWSGDAELVLVLPETGASAAEVPVGRVLSALQTLAPESRAGLSVCPDDACDLDTLLAGAREAARTSSPRGIGTLPDADTTLTVGQDSIVVADPAMKRLFALVGKLAASELPVLVRGETGVGKEVVAAALHAWSPRSRGRLVAINCAAVPEALIESQLFGHERGAFSGAIAQKAGLFELADGGTVFLDEVGELSPGAQAKLLRVLEAKTVTRVGSVSERAVDVRIVAATNRPLEAQIAGGEFRQDLYFRLCAATVFVPPLRERRLDLARLARIFLQRAAEQAGRTTPKLGVDAIAKLSRYRWPGNVRELRNVMAYAVATCEGEFVDETAFPEDPSGGANPAKSGAASSPADPRTPPPPRQDGQVRLTPSTSFVNVRAPQHAEPSAHAEPLESAGPPETSSAFRAPTQSGFRNIYDEIRELERFRMEEALAATGGVRVRAAALIGMPLRTFVTKLKEYGLGGTVGRRPR